MSKCLMVLALLSVIAAATMVPTARAAQVAPVAPYDMNLGVAARWALNAAKLNGNVFATRQVYVRCYRSDNDFVAAAMWRFGEDLSYVWAYTRRNSKTVYMRGPRCAAAHSFLRKVKANHAWSIQPSEVGAYATLLHEALHVQGYKDERLTECVANDTIRWATVGWYQGITRSSDGWLSSNDANRLSRMAFDWSARMVARSYHSNPSVCQSLLSQADWTGLLV